ncbi:hypothetical protein HOE37_06580 [Candidatus Woesearchaeota archaeon]|jgi:hypothetical protein|nr:hypothetical protein [Candidatus Woesearchaeota archaeon]
MKQKINILTRTAERPHYFKRVRDSLRSQTYTNIRHIVATDNYLSQRYVQDDTINFRGIPDTEIIKVNREPRKNFEHFPYNLYCNDLKAKVEEGWIFYLDDDNVFIKDNALELMLDYVSSEDDLLVFKVDWLKKAIPSHSFGKEITFCDCDTACFLFHSKHKDLVDWEGVKGGDFKFFKELSTHLDVVWLNQTLLNINVGSGNREDI